jgi:alpha-1,6-mannosyltransferase
MNADKDKIKRSFFLRLCFALVAELFFFGALNFFDDWTLASMPIKFVEAAFLSGIAYLLAAASFKIDIGPRKQAIIFWSAAVALRLIALPLEPSDDLWRYQWEGKIQRAGFNPYLVAPDDPKLDELRQNFPDWSKINHRDFRAIYPPGAEIVFRFLSGISDRPLFFKLVFAIFDLAAVFLLLRLMEGGVPATPGAPELASPPYSAVAWYAWNPLVAYSFAGAAHFDSLMILPMVGGILCLVRSETETANKWNWALAAAALFGIAISIKLIPVLLLLLCIFALRSRAIVLALSLAIPAALSLPYGFPKIRIWDSLGEFAYVTRLNDLFWWLIEDTIWANPHQKNYRYNVVVIICVIAVSLLFIQNWKRGTLWALGTALVLSPVVHPWYCTWILPLATWRRAYAWHMLSVTLFAYYLFWDERLFALPWHAEPWMRALIIVPVLAALVMFAVSGWRNKATAAAVYYRR